MPDLHEIIETRAGADHCVSGRSSINRRISTDFDIVFNNNPPKLWDSQKSIFGGGKSKSFLSDPRRGRRKHVLPEAHGLAGMANPTIRTNNHAAADNRARTDQTAGPISAPDSITDSGPISVDGSTRAPSATIADGWIPGETGGTG